MKTLSQTVAEKLTRDAEYHWTRMHAAKAKGLPVAVEFQRREYNRRMAAAKYLQSR